MDHRTHYSAVDLHNRRQQILDCLYQMLHHTAYKDITVSALCQELGIVRKVFYKHFRDKEDCLGGLIDQVLWESLTYTIEHAAQWGLTPETAQAILEYWLEKRDFLDIITRNHLLEVFMERAFATPPHDEIASFRCFDHPLLPCDSDILGCYLSCHFALIIQWYHRGFDTPVEEMAKKYLRITTSPLLIRPI